MKTLNIKMTKQLFFQDSRIKIFVDGKDYGTIQNAETKSIECENNNPTIRFESRIKILELFLSLKENNQIEVFWKKYWGNIGFTDSNHIVTSKKNNIKWKNYILLSILLIALLLFLIFNMEDLLNN